VYTMAKKWLKEAAAVLFGFCLIGPTIDLLSTLPSLTGLKNHLRRSLATDQTPDQPSVYPWARDHLRPLNAIPEPSKETSLFWHIPRSGGSTVKSVYECFGKTLAHEAGVDPRYGHQSDDEIIAFSPWPGISRASYVNVDTTNRPGILRAKRLGLVPSGLADMIVTSDPTFVIENLFDETHKGRVLALFRHPIDRLVSKFFYLQKATWEQQYRPQWKNIDILEFAKRRNSDNNHMVKKLAGLEVNQTATEDDMRMAMRTIRKRFIVGLMDKMEESIHRFNAVMGINESVEDNRQCMDHFFHHALGAKKHNSDSHPHVDPGSAAWNALAKRNQLDIRLYEFVLELYDEQREIIDIYTSSIA